MSTTRSLFTAAVAASMLASVAGCSSGDDSANATFATTSAPTATSAATAAVTSAATSAPTAITLTIGTDDSPGVPSADEIQHFAAEVSSLSGGRVTIEPRWHAEGDNNVDWDQAVAALVQSGELDLALGPTWAWDVLGVNSFQPIQSPFLIDSDELLAKVITDGEVNDQLMAGLPDAGVEGIALWPEGLRHPFGFDHPLLTPDDFTGQVIRSPKSEASTKLFDALGATTSAAEPDATTMVGTQAEFALSPNGIGAANVTWFPKVNVLYANSDAWAGLDPATKDLLTQAAANTQAWAIERTDDVAAGEGFCNDGGELVTATPEQVQALQTATRPVADAIAADHGDVVAAITALKDALPTPVAAAACTAATPDVEHVPGAAESALNGEYRFTITTQELLDAGANESIARQNEGVQNFTLEDGVMTYRLDPTGAVADATDTPPPGTYQVDGDQLTLRFPALDNEVDRLRFVVDGEGNLHMTFVDSTAGDAVLELLLAGKPWERIE